VTAPGTRDERFQPKTRLRPAIRGGTQRRPSTHSPSFRVLRSEPEAISDVANRPKSLVSGRHCLRGQWSAKRGLRISLRDHRLVNETERLSATYHHRVNLPQRRPWCPVYMIASTDPRRCAAASHQWPRERLLLGTSARP